MVFKMLFASSLMLENKSKEPIDREILPLLNKINSLKEYKTTSSCSGRISLLRGSAKKQKNIFLKKWHRTIKVNEVLNELKKHVKKTKEQIWLRQEGIIIHVIASDIKSAKKILSLAQNSGIKHSGIMAFNKKIVLEIMTTEKVDCPVADKGKILINKEYLDVLVKEANLRLKESRKKMRRFYKLIKNSF